MGVGIGVGVGTEVAVGSGVGVGVGSDYMHATQKAARRARSPIPRSFLMPSLPYSSSDTSRSRPSSINDSTTEGYSGMPFLTRSSRARNSLSPGTSTRS